MLVRRFVSSQAFFPPSCTYDEHLDKFQWIPTQHGYMIAAIAARNTRARFAVVYSHGNAEDLGLLSPWLQQWAVRMGCSMYAYDYCGYGLTPGTPSERKCFENVQAVFDYVVGTEGFAPHQVLSWGYSIGSGPATYLAWRQWTVRYDGPRDAPLAEVPLDARPIGPLVLMAPVYSAVSVVSRPLALLARPFFSDIMLNYTRLPYVRSPLLLVHGARDSVVPYDHGVDLFARAANPWRMLTYEECDHVDLSRHDAEILRAVVQCVDEFYAAGK